MAWAYELAIDTASQRVIQGCITKKIQKEKMVLGSCYTQLLTSLIGFEEYQAKSA